MRRGLEFDHLFRQLLTLLLQHFLVDQDTSLFHLQQHRHEWLFDVHINVAKRIDLIKFRPQGFVQLECYVSVFGRIGCRYVEIDLVERQLLGAFARDVFKMNGFASEVKSCRRVHVVSDRNAVQDIGLKHRIEAHARQFYAMTCEYVSIIFEVMADLLALRIFEKKSKFFKYFLARKLIWRARIIVRNGYIGGLAGRDTQ